MLYNALVNLARVETPKTDAETSVGAIASKDWCFKESPCLAFSSLLKQVFCEKVASNALQELPALIEQLLATCRYEEIMGHLN